MSATLKSWKVNEKQTPEEKKKRSVYTVKWICQLVVMELIVLITALFFFFFRD